MVMGRRARSGVSLGIEFRRLWLASAGTNLGDGALLVAGPLLVATLTRDPPAIAGAAFAQQLPWLLFSLTAGALVDRLPRRSLIVTVNLLRAAVLATLTVTISTGVVSIWILYGALFALGLGETLVDTAYGTVVASIVPRDSLGRANARLALTFSLNNQLIGPPLGALLFAALSALPFGFHAMMYGVAALTVSRMAAIPPSEAPDDVRKMSHLREIAEGLAWLWRNPGMRTLTLCILVMNVTGVGAFAIWVLYATERLGLDEIGFGLFVSAGAIGGLVGSRVYEWLEPRLGRSNLLRAGLVVETLTYAALALTTSPIVAGLVMVVFGVHAVVWGAAAATIRQRLTPAGLLGRVTGAYRLADIGGGAMGALIGGQLASRIDLLTPFWAAFVAVAMMTALMWTRLGKVEPVE